MRVATGNDLVHVTVDNDGHIGLHFGKRIRGVHLEDPIKLADTIYEEFRRARISLEVFDGPGD